MDRQQIKNEVIAYFREQIAFMASRPSFRPQIQMGALYERVQRTLGGKVQSYEHENAYSIVREVIQELICSGFLYPGTSGDQNSGYPWLTITTHGKVAFVAEDWLPHDPEGYIAALRQRVPKIDDVTLAYIGESVAAFNRRHLLSATITLGVASENLMLLLIEAYTSWLKDPKRKSAFEKRIADKWIATQYKEFKAELNKDVKLLPKELQGDWEIYLDGIFNFIRLNRNDAGHPTGRQLDAKIVYANLQIFSEYTKYVFDLINFCV